MEIGFIIIMLFLVVMASTFIYLVYTHRNRFHWECCGEWKRKTTKQENEL